MSQNYYPNDGPTSDQTDQMFAYPPAQNFPPSAVMPPPPTYVPQPQTSSGGNSRRVALIVGVVVAVLLVVGGLLVALLSGGKGGLGGKASAQSVFTSYCTDVKSQNYAKAYTTFSPSLQKLMAPAAYVAAAQSLDSEQGKVTNCAFSKEALSSDSKTSTITATFGRGTATGQSTTYTLVQSGGPFQFSKAPELALLPLSTAATFCLDVGSGKTDQAYALLTPNLQQQIGTASDFKNELTTTGQITGNLTNCHLQTTTFSGTTAALALGIDFDRFPNVPAKMSQVPAASGAYLIDSLTISAAGVDIPFPIPTNLQQLLQILQGILSGSGQ